MHNVVIYNDLITSLITLKVILENIDKINIVKGLEINNKSKELETEKIDELEFLQENLRFRTLKNKFWKKKQTELRRNRVKRTDKEKES